MKTVREERKAMSILQDVLSKLPLLTPQDRDRVFESLDQRPDETRFPSIVKTPGVCGGSARLIRTRIPVWILERYRQLGANDQDILRNYPSLQASDLNQAWMYVNSNPDEIEREIQENEEV
jgi:uncharacterized protein (DUF433 family)